MPKHSGDSQMPASKKGDWKRAGTELAGPARWDTALGMRDTYIS